jgi:SAM-dependent methyltransferase
MGAIGAEGGLLARPLVYAMWQAPFERRKLEPVFRHNDWGGIRRVLDVGCGPGTSTKYFRHSAYYLGIDNNPEYVRYARRKHQRDFLVADVTRLPARSVDSTGTFDFILVNSMLHHLNDEDCRQLLLVLLSLLSPDGHLHCLELVMPERGGIGRVLAKADRGQYARSVAHWGSIWTEIFQPVTTVEYPLGAGGLTLWNMIYFKGRRPG